MQLRGYRRTETVSSPSGSGGEGSRLQALRLNQQGPSGEPQGPCVAGVGVAGEWGGSGCWGGGMSLGSLAGNDEACYEFHRRQATRSVWGGGAVSP